jgi:hypothetical protein
MGKEGKQALAQDQILKNSLFYQQPTDRRWMYIENLNLEEAHRKKVHHPGHHTSRQIENVLYRRRRNDARNFHHGGQ